MVILTSSFVSASRMRLHEQTPETSFGAEVYHQTSLVIDTHACRIQCTWQKNYTKKTDSSKIDYISCE